MSPDNKKLLYRHLDKNYMEVVDQGEYRSLYFRGGVVQSRISLREPDRLVLRYTRYMMAASLLAQSHPEHILLVGIGAGALLHFLHRHVPGCRIEAVDYSEHIIDIAREYFGLPEDERLTVHCADGLHYLAELEGSRRYDVILVDAFNDTGMAQNIYSSEFFKLAGRHLTNTGILCCNLWSGNRDVYHQVQKAILKHSCSSLFIPVRRRENVIALLFQSSLPWKTICPPAPMLIELGNRYNLDFDEVSAAAQRNNMRLGERLQRWLS